jgi:L-asparagine transporter-like permease
LLLVYLGVVSATIALRYKKTRGDKGSFKVPGGLVIPVLAILAIIWLLNSLSIDEMKYTTIFLVVISAIFLLMRAFKNKKPSA